MSPALAAAYADCRARLAARGVHLGPSPILSRPAVIASEPAASAKTIDCTQTQPKQTS